MAATKIAAASKPKKTSEAKETTPAKHAPREPAASLSLRWDLAALPSSQHRAGLAGLVLVLRWLDRNPGAVKGACRIAALDARGATVELDEAGLGSLFDEIYAATTEEVPYPQQRKGKDKNPVEAIRTVEQESTDPKTGKVKKKTLYVYPQVIPKGSFLADLDNVSSGASGLWIKLWRDVLWGVLRGVPATRRPYEDRAEGVAVTDAEETYSDLLKPSAYSVDLPSTYFVGAQAATAESVSFSDRARDRFLLHFWPFATPVYCPAVVNNDGEREFRGFALAFPDVADLEAFCDDYQRVLQQRPHEKSGYRPRGAVIDLIAEGGLDLLLSLGSELARHEGNVGTSDLLLGVDVFHLEREGNNVRVRGATRVLPELQMTSEYDRVGKAYWDPVFRHQRLLNLVARRPWHRGFDTLCATRPLARTFGSNLFQHDARVAFTDVEAGMETTAAPTPKSLEAIVYQVIGNYISRKVDAKTNLRWEAVKDNPGQKAKYEEARGKVAKDAFLAVRSRTGADFVAYFSGSLCSVAQHIGEESYLLLTKSLLSDPETVRTLTLLALSARG